MARKFTYPAGSSHYGFTVLDAGIRYKGTNRLIRIKCDSCGTERECWNSAYRAGRLVCAHCNSVAVNNAKALASNDTILAVYDDHIDLLTSEENLPEGVRLFRVVSDTMAMPLHIGPKPIPGPDQDVIAYVAVPEAYLPYYCSEADLDDETTAKAQALYEELVDEDLTNPARCYSVHSRGSQTSWYVDGVKYAYLYWRDRKTWPRKPPEAVEATLPQADLEQPLEDPPTTLPELPEPTEGHSITPSTVSDTLKE